MTLEDLKLAHGRYQQLRNGPAYNRAWLELRAVVAPRMDLQDARHRQALLTFLKKWRNRHISMRLRDPDWFLNNLVQWGIQAQPALSRLGRRRLWTLKADDLKMMGSLLEALAEVKVTPHLRLGYVAAAKLLFALLPDVFPIWDGKILRRLGLPKSAAGYMTLCEQIRHELTQLEMECRPHQVSTTLGVKGWPLLKLVDEYLFT